MKYLFKFRVYEIIYTDYHDPVKTLVFDGYRWGVSEKQIKSQIRHEYSLYDHDANNGSEDHVYEFVFERSNCLNNIVFEDVKKDGNETIEEGYNDYGFVRNGIKFATEEEAYEYFNNVEN